MKALRIFFVSSGVALLAACSGDPGGGGFLNSTGQVTVTTPSPTNVSAYAAARFLEQASWGPTPQSVQEVQRLGMSGWIDQQFKTAVSVAVAPSYVIDYDDTDRVIRDKAWAFFPKTFYDHTLGGPDQLRQRAAWALYNFIVVGSAGYAYGKVEYYNTLQRGALGSFSDLIRNVTLNPLMGEFLNNNQNRADRPNENYARELMQLFTVGLVKLNPDGSVQRDATGKALETYTQQDVIQATKALSGWNNDSNPFLPQTNRSNYGKPMIAETWQGAHDSSSKSVLGSAISGGQSASQDLDSLIHILVNHPNTAPFVSRRLIQNMVSSNPSPAYLGRISAVFSSSRGDLAQVVKAILLDPEARAGDDPTQQIARNGKMKEPVLAHTNLLRAMGCTQAVADSKNWHSDRVYEAWTQQAYFAPSVFGYFSPGHTAPESLVPAPEQKLITADELRRKASDLTNRMEVKTDFTQAGCEVDLFINAAATSDEALIALINERFFKGALPAPLRLGAKNLLSQDLANQTPQRKFTELLQILISTPTFGVVK
ncbi:DUF1800 domain-containing protein [Limnohabitans sp.]|uniref:DUF1800 domain-containing protein n=1 Tax=Limnohabitans sp. TaxID=1907725 RepID=UPI002AFE8E4A|nr:DUF1800 family protein [Limnohabitans sp.]